MPKECFTAEQLIAEARRLTKLGGPTTFVSFGASFGPHSNDKKGAGLAVYPDDLLNSRTAKTFYGTFPEMIAAAEEFIAGYAPAREAETVRRMALAIIDITDRLGGCSDTNLKADNFSLTEIGNLHVRACEAASRMSGNAPFVVTMSVARAA